MFLYRLLYFEQISKAKPLRGFQSLRDIPLRAVHYYFIFFYNLSLGVLFE